VAFGDAENDLGLFAAVNLSVGVANALPSVRERADEVIGTNTDDSVALWLERDWHLRKTDKT
jgi:hydroxymethylpyrimidine pyrophosphatase-like HAD family hydrolase